ncbi:methanogenesis marker 6 protein [Methanosarcinales archaeon]|nr:MAG: methanogenesis marker 6 protein [Methanosarcinales archaeon]
MRSDVDGVVTKLIILSSRRVMPGELLSRIYSLKKDLIVKETCFGAEVSGKKGDVEQVVREVRSLDPYGIFVKERGFLPGDPRRCRATRGGARPGFHQIELEAERLPLIAKALSEYDMGALGVRREEVGALGVDRFKEIIEDTLKDMKM